MKVKVEMIIETEDFGEKEFRREIEILIADIDRDAELLEFKMYELPATSYFFKPQS